MSAYVDELMHHPRASIRDPRARRVSEWWCHLVADTDDELHEFAARIGLRRSWAQLSSVMNHYDLTPGKRAEAIRNGAIERSMRDVLRERRRKEREAQEGQAGP